jgi:hypothetical protein
VRLHLNGTQAECELLAAGLPRLLAGTADVVAVSAFYPNRGTAFQGRIYAEIHLSRMGGLPL